MYRVLKGFSIYNKERKILRYREHDFGKTPKSLEGAEPSVLLKLEKMGYIEKVQEKPEKKKKAIKEEEI